MRFIFKKRGSLQSRGLRLRKHRWLIFKVMAGLTLFVLLFCGLSFLSFANVFQINAISVTGTHVLNAAAIEAGVRSSLVKPSIFFFSRNTALTYPKHEIAGAIEAQGLIVKKVEVSLSGFRSLFIKITERMPVASWCHKGECLLLDDTGLAYTSGSSTDPQIVFDSATTSVPFTPGSYVASTERFQPFMNFLAVLPQTGFSPDHAALSLEGDITLSSASPSKPDLIVALDQDFTKTVGYLASLVNDASFKAKLTPGILEYIDVRFGNKIYYKPYKNTKTDSASTTIPER